MNKIKHTCLGQKTGMDMCVCVCACVCLLITILGKEIEIQVGHNVKTIGMNKETY